MRTIDRYILQELGVPFAQSLGALTFILMTREILRLVELLINKGVGLLPLLKTFVLLLPSFFVLTLPMGCLIASISAFSRLSSTGNSPHCTRRESARGASFPPSCCFRSRFS